MKEKATQSRGLLKRLAEPHKQQQEPPEIAAFKPYRLAPLRLSEAYIHDG